MEYTEIRDIIQREYDKQTTDTNYNFISRFAKAVYEAQNEVKNLSSNSVLSDSLPSVHQCRYSKAMNQEYPRKCVDCGKPEGNV